MGPYRFIILLLQMVEQQDLDLELEGTRSKVTMNLVPRPVPPSLPTPLLIMLVFRGQVTGQLQLLPYSPSLVTTRMLTLVLVHLNLDMDLLLLVQEMLIAMWLSNHRIQGCLCRCLYYRLSLSRLCCEIYYRFRICLFLWYRI